MEGQIEGALFLACWQQLRKPPRPHTLKNPRNTNRKDHPLHTMAERKAVIKNADMGEEMQQEAVDCASQAMDKHNIEKDIAAFIKKEFDKKVS